MIRWITNYTTQKFSFRKGEKKLIIFVFFFKFQAMKTRMKALIDKRFVGKIIENNEKK